MDKNKYMFRILCLTLIIVIIVTISFSYAYFTPVISKVGSNLLNIKSADYEVSFATSQYLDCENVVPINNSEYLTKACKSTFTVTATGTTEVNYRIGINGMDVYPNDVNIVITEGANEYVIPDYGISGDISAEGAILLNDSITPPGSKTYNLYVWLEDDGTDQTDLLGYTFFTAKIFVESIPDEDDY